MAGLGTFEKEAYGRFAPKSRHLPAGDSGLR